MNYQSYQGLLSPQLDRLPIEIIMQILSNLTYEQVKTVCSTPANRRLRSVCSRLIQNEDFWRQKFERDILPNLTYDEQENLPNGYPGISSQPDTWRNYFLKVYNSDLYRKALLRRQLRNINIRSDTRLSIINADDLISKRTAEAYLLGVFLLPIALARQYLNIYLRRGSYTRYGIQNVQDIPNYLPYIQDYLQNLDEEGSDSRRKRSPIHKVPTGENYGFRQALIILAENGLTPEQAQKRLDELGLTVNSADE